MPYVGHKAVGMRKSCWSCPDCLQKPTDMQKALFGMTMLTGCKVTLDAMTTQCTHHASAKWLILLVTDHTGFSQHWRITHSGFEVCTSRL